MTTPEGKIKVMTSEALDNLCCYRFMPVQRGFGPAGLDYFCCYLGRFFAVETKVPGKKLEPRQVATAKAVALAGGCVFAVRHADDIARMQRVLRAGDKLFGLIYDELGSKELYGGFWCQ
jgi:hypothetical protein